MLRVRPRRPKRWATNRMVPNALTVMALCAGLTAIRFAVEGRWELATLAIVAAGILDGLDGRIARLLKGTSKFGAELDSLSDFISFGAAPAVLMYQWSLVGMRNLGWLVALLYAVCCALRLARFNTEIDQPEEARPAFMRYYFKGVAAPAAAGLTLLPMFQWHEKAWAGFRSPLVVVPLVTAVALLMISRVPTFSIKRFTVPHRFVVPALLLVGLMFAALASEPWITLATVGALYVASLPAGILLERRQRLRHSAEASPAAAAEPAAVPAAPGVVVPIQPRPASRG